MPIVTISSTSVNPRFEHGGFKACPSLGPSLGIDNFSPLLTRGLSGRIAFFWYRQIGGLP
jgi:hypothetical protein